MNIDFKTLTEEQLADLSKDINKEIDCRRREKEQAAKETIRKLAADVGLKVSFAEGKPVAARKAKKKELA